MTGAMRVRGRAGLVITLLMVLPFLAALSVYVVRGLPDFLVNGDQALLEQATLEAVHGEQQLGPYNRFGFNHPGPAFFYAAAPLYAATGRHASALFVVALGVNLLSVLALLFALRRVSGPARELLFAGLFALFLLNTGDRLGSAWNPYVSLLPFFVFVLSLLAILCGRRWWMPVGALAASFAVQCHFAYLPAALVLLVLTPAIGWWLRDRGDIPVPRRWAAPALVTAGVLLALWWRPLRAEWAAGSGNLQMLVNFFRAHGNDQPTHLHVRAWARVFSDYLIAPLALAGGTEAARADGVMIGLALALWVVFAWSLVRLLRNRVGDRTGAALGLLTLGLSAALSISVFHIVGPIYEYLLTWMVGAGFLMCLCIAWSWSPGRVARAVLWLLVAGWAGFGTARLVRDARQNLAWSTETESGRAAAESVSNTLAAMQPFRDCALHVRQLDDGVWKIRAALVLALSKQGFHPTLDGHWFYEYVPARLAWPSATSLFLASPPVARCALPGPGLRMVASNALCTVLFSDQARMLEQPAHSYENPFTAPAAWPYAPAPGADLCGYPLVGPAFTMVFILRPHTAYHLALDARPLVPELTSVEATLNGVPLAGDLLRQEVALPAAGVHATNTLALAFRGVAATERRPTLAFGRLLLTVADPPAAGR